MCVCEILIKFARCRIEVAVKQILSGIKIKTNASVANPEALAWFEQWAASQP
jgi:acetoacetyl-CoA synthetase